MGLGVLSSSGGGDDNLQVGLAVFCVVVSLMVTAMVPMLVPEYDADADVLEDARQKMENFTGETMISSSPWKLTSVRTPYTANAQENIISEYGWVYGSISTSYVLDGKQYVGEEVIRMDPAQKSFRQLVQGEEQSGWGETEYFIFSDNWAGDAVYTVASFFGDLVGWNVERTHGELKNGQAFDFDGLLYHFDPTYRISTQGSSATDLNSQMASLNVIWYDTGSDSGISSGLVLQSDKSKAIIANYSSMDIINAANTNSQFATKYLLNFDGVQVYMYIMFDNSVLTGNMALIDAWNLGYWSIAFSSPSADGLMDIFNANNLSSSMGNLLDTYLSIFTFDMPNCPTAWNLVLWVVCVLPMEIAMIMFLSRFGAIGLVGGILANAFAFLGGVL